jgi:DNA-binding MarR family transcriptional regulator
MWEMADSGTTTTTARSKRTAPTVTVHVEAWDSLSRTYAAVSLRLQEALAQNDHPPLPWFEVLAAVDAAPEQRMRMGDLAEALVMTRGGLTKLIDRLVKAGLLERTYCETDRRVSYATLLPAGAELLEEMRPVIAAEIELAFAAQLDAREASELRGILERVQSSACGTG